MRILIYSYNYSPEPIGIAPLMTELAEGLVKRGHQVRVVTAMPNYPERRIYENYRGKWFVSEYKNGVQIQRSYVWIRPQPNLIDRLLLDASFVLTSFFPAIAGWRPDVILSTSPSLPVCLPTAFLGWLYRCPVVLNLQDILPDAALHVGLLKNKLLIKVLTALEKFAYHSATKISVIADGFVENLQKKGVALGKIAQIPNWVDINFVRPLPKENNAFRVAHNLDGKFVVLYSGNIALTQGLETVVTAASLLRHIPEITFVIVGEAKGLQRLQMACTESGADNVLLLPFQPRESLPELLAAADVGLVVQKKNVISFNMPSKIQILLGSGRAVVGSVPSNGTAARAIKQSAGGVVVPPEKPEALAKAILDLYNNPEKVKTLGCNSRKFAVEQYAFEQALTRYESLFYSVLAEDSTIEPLVNSFAQKRLLLRPKESR
ncbi:MAG: WcaI family glycosyltransferase [Brasilonema octagenarum HA4186-MV1]|jgi:colanic acid biosynthesis glycosyl transferase WcaI|uniref:Colanic acid biosynthesis glycosyltransferase WcaI n=2 Tax=Brasilonema TaxID=383614 RepID=A0A856MPH8_9CYAN|nr:MULTISPECIES: WcaI family glycosyltransferase [Brasilonema]MBW4625262.1 WcaI family glycosyltransferase [Brasilonema octagenarum HA4186-MV1]NMF65063.1 colanic acid biosynthesis glycosyltransferase WcaI [Brasilonema octagenarum UFV-OR1]QDL10886.1 colanic acid biosynthesis glycosyltransferase WcaI [Brasilonema sennae CENA114]QDL17234.1 colanic acid biosynthesis glycosyltransferase WcaI [Brasilonema octagenarum UFV-E1]